MKIRFFLFGTKNRISASRTEEELRQIFFGQLNDNGDIQSFDNIRDATGDIAKAVADSHVLVFIADSQQYGTTKQMLAKAFGFEMGCDTALLQKACETLGKDKETEDYNFSVTHAFIAKNSRAFVLDDGLYAGFSVANGNQTIIILPYEKDRTSVLVSTQLVPYLNASYHLELSADKVKVYNAQRLYETLSTKEVSLAVAGTTTAGFLKEYLSCEERLSSLVSVSPIAEKRGNLQPVDYVVNLSITASEFLSCPYSVAISNAFYTGDSPESEKIVYIAVSNERETAVREIHSFKGEEIHAFLTRCCGDLCMFVCDVIADDDSFNADMKIREKATVKRYKISLAAVAAVIVALAVFCVSYFAANDYSFSTWFNNFMEWVFPAGNPFEGMFEDSFGDGEDLNAHEKSTASEASSTETDEETTEAENEASTEENVTEEKTTEENEEMSSDNSFLVG